MYWIYYSLHGELLWKQICFCRHLNAIIFGYGFLYAFYLWHSLHWLLQATSNIITSRTCSRMKFWIWIREYWIRYTITRKIILWKTWMSWRIISHSQMVMIPMWISFFTVIVFILSEADINYYTQANLLHVPDRLTEFINGMNQKYTDEKTFYYPVISDHFTISVIVNTSSSSYSQLHEFVNQV